MVEWCKNVGTALLVAGALFTVMLLSRRVYVPTLERPAASELVADWSTYGAAGHRRGRGDAPVTLIVFSDFQCTASRYLDDQLKRIDPELMEEIAIVFRHFPLEKHAFARAAATAAECAAEQGRFQEFRDVLFREQLEIGSAHWRFFAESAALPDPLAFDRCTDSAGSPGVQQDIEAARALKVTKVPTLLVNGLRVEGALPAETLNILIRRALDVSTPEPLTPTVQNHP